MNDKELIAEADKAYEDVFNVAKRERDLIRRLADALEAATRERDAATAELEAQLANAKAGWDSALRIVNEGNEIIKQVGAERDDLATRLSEYLCDSTGGLLSKTGYDVRTMVAHTEEYYDRVHAEERKEVEAERDAALAAVGRVRAMHRRLNIVDEVTDERLGDACEVCYEIESYELTWPCPTIAALDGAPEPEEGDAEYQAGCGSWDCRAPECGRA